jgi:hypothetical protein
LQDIERLAKLAGNDLKDFDLFIHAGIDGVLSNMPPSGLTDKVLGAYGFKRVMSGHYHHQKLLDHGVISIGATTHQTWSDLDSRAGFLIVDGDAVRIHASHAPSFVDVSGKSEDDAALLADGNYVRFRGQQMTNDQVKELRQFLEESGALGVSIQATKPAVNARSTTGPTAGGATIAESVQKFVDTTNLIPAHVDRDEVKREAADVLAKSQLVAEDA